jgi:hypothetical protein
MAQMPIIVTAGYQRAETQEIAGFRAGESWLPLFYYYVTSDRCERVSGVISVPPRGWSLSFF